MNNKRNKRQAKKQNNYPNTLTTREEFQFHPAFGCWSRRCMQFLLNAKGQIVECLTTWRETTPEPQYHTYRIGNN